MAVWDASIWAVAVWEVAMSSHVNLSHLSNPLEHRQQVAELLNEFLQAR